MTKRTSDVPQQVTQAAESTWSKWRKKLAHVPPAEESDEMSFFAAQKPLGAAGMTPKQRMIEKIKRRMQEYPRWYETDPQKVATYVAEELDRIGAVLDRKLPEAKGAVEVWEIPLSVFNWLAEDEEGETFVHGALSAWASAENFNAANSPDLDPAQKQKLRESFMQIAPVLLKAVLEELLETGLRISFAEKFVGPELKYLVMRVKRPL